jgi:hypothetical protein
MEYWDKENARRADLRKVVAAKQKEIAKKEGGWLWRTGWRGWKSVGIWGKSRRQMENERIALKEKLSADRSIHQKRRRESMLRSDSHSRSSSRSMTPGPPDPDRPSSRRGGERRGSSASSTGTVKRSKKPGIHMSRLSMTEGAPEVPSPLTTRASNLSTSSSGSDSVKKESTPPMDDVAHSVEREIKQEPVD